MISDQDCLSDISMRKRELLILLIGAIFVCVAPDVGRSEQMIDETTGGPPEKPPADASELQKFARRFTKEWRLHSETFIGIAYGYIQQLPPDRKAILEKEFRAFLYESGADSDQA